MTLNHDRDILTLAQITDSHLGDCVGDTLLGMDVDDSLAQVVALIKQDWPIADESPAVDVLLATGDLSNTGSQQSYRRFAQATEDIARHTLWLPGNHDNLPAMEAAFLRGRSRPRVARAGAWCIVMLDSRIPGAVGGHLAESELTLLRQALEASRGEHVLVCLHHHPVDIGCAWLDGQRVANADALFGVLDDFSQVRGLLWGHIHQQIDIERKGVKLMASPSSCIQFAPGQEDFKLDRLNPGYRWLQLYKDGQIDTGVSRISKRYVIDYDYCGGY